MPRARLNGKLRTVVEQLCDLLDQKKPDAGQVLLKSKNVARLTNGAATRELIGEVRWAKLQLILHPPKKDPKDAPALVNAA